MENGKSHSGLPRDPMELYRKLETVEHYQYGARRVAPQYRENFESENKKSTNVQTRETRENPDSRSHWTHGVL